MVLQLKQTKAPGIGLSFRRKITLCTYRGQDNGANGLAATALAVGNLVCVDIRNVCSANTFTDPQDPNYFLRNVIIAAAGAGGLTAGGYSDTFWGVALRAAAQNQRVPILWSGIAQVTAGGATLGAPVTATINGNALVAPNASFPRNKIVGIFLSNLDSGMASVLFEGIHGLGQVDNFPV